MGFIDSKKVLYGRGGKETTSSAAVKGSFSPVPNGIAKKYESTAALSLRYTQKIGGGKMGLSFRCISVCLFPLRCLVRYRSVR